MSFRFQPYRNHDQDADRVLGFLSRISTHPAYLSDYMVGDFVWGGYAGHQIGYDERIGIWQGDGGEVAGICWITPPNETAFVIDPDLRGTDAERTMIGEMMDWTLLRLPDLRGDNTEPIGATVSSHDKNQQKILADLGLVFSGESWFNAYARSIAEPIEVPQLPEGFRFAEMDDSADLTQRVEIHRDVWAPSKLTLAGYLKLRQAPIYRSDLDLAVVAPDGRFATYLIAWLDPEARTLEFEPVGAREEFRGRGLTRALMLEAMRRGRELGAERAYVLSYTSAEPANALYRSCGFEIVTTLDWWHYPAPDEPARGRT
jgi:mycothiol synthase